MHWKNGRSCNTVLSYRVQHDLSLPLKSYINQKFYPLTSLTTVLSAKSQNRDSRDFSSSPWNFWSIEYNHALYWKFGTMTGLESRPQAHMAMRPKHKTFLVLRPFEGALTCSILIAGTQVMLRKAYFLRRGSWLRPKSWTPRPRIQNPRRTIETHTSTECWKFQLSRLYTGREIAHRQTDGRMNGRHNDFNRAHFL
jgi:hypothetical protein